MNSFISKHLTDFDAERIKCETVWESIWMPC